MNDGNEGYDSAPLEGTKVLDFSVLLPGPACTQKLAWFGAEVLKVEPPEGDPARRLYGGHLWHLYNRGKSSLRIDLKDPENRETIRRMVSDFDIVIEGFRPGVADRLGFGYETLKAEKPDLIYCSIAGFSPGDVRASQSSHDLIFTASSGAMGEPGNWRAQDLEITRPLVPAGDLMSSDAAVQSILAALLRRDRIGEGARFTISASDAALYAVASRAVAGGEDAPSPHLDPANDVYRASDGRWVAIAAVEPKFWRSLCGEVGLDELGKGVETWDWPKRQLEGEAISRALDRQFELRTSSDWVRRLEELDVPVTLVLTPTEAFEMAKGRGIYEDGWMAPPLPFGRELEPAPE